MAEAREVREVNPENAGNDKKECSIDCVAFLFKDGKGSANYQSKNKLRCPVNREGRRLCKLRECIW